MKDKIIIFDASTLITIAMNGLLEELKMLKKLFKGKFIIPEEVKYEIIDRPIKIKRFELEAMKLQNLLEDGIIELPSSLGIDSKRVSKETEVLMSIANTTFEGKGKNIHLIDLGETACLVLSKILDERKIQNVVAVDERTTRMLCEKPENLKELLQKKLKIRINSDQENYHHFAGFRFIRSAELVYFAYKKGIIRWKNKDILDALLYAVKFKGCAISEDEIQEIKKLG
jgi:hypothetical protein